MADKIGGGGGYFDRMKDATSGLLDDAADVVGDAAQTAADVVKAGAEDVAAGAKGLVSDAAELGDDALEVGRESLEELERSGAAAGKRAGKALGGLKDGALETVQDFKDALALPSRFASSPMVTSDAVRSLLEGPVTTFIQSQLEDVGVSVTREVKEQVRVLESAFVETASEMGGDELVQSVIVAFGGADGLGLSPDKAARAFEGFGQLLTETVERAGTRIDGLVTEARDDLSMHFASNDKDSLVATMALKTASHTSIFQTVYSGIKEQVVGFVENKLFGTFEQHYAELEVGDKTKVDVHFSGEVYKVYGGDAGSGMAFEVMRLSDDPDKFRMSFAVKGEGKLGVGFSKGEFKANVAVSGESEVSMSLDVDGDKLMESLSRISVLSGEGLDANSIAEWADGEGGVTFHGAHFDAGFGVGGEVDFKGMGMGANSKLVGAKADLVKANFRNVIAKDSKGELMQGVEWKATTGLAGEVGLNAMGISTPEGMGLLSAGDVVGIVAPLAGDELKSMADGLASLLGDEGALSAKVSMSADGRVVGMFSPDGYSNEMNVRAQFDVQDGAVEMVMSTKTEGLHEYLSQSEIGLYTAMSMTDPEAAHDMLRYLAGERGFDFDDVVSMDVSFVFHRKEASKVSFEPVSEFKASVGLEKTYASVTLAKWDAEGKTLVSHEDGFAKLEELRERTRYAKTTGKKPDKVSLSEEVALSRRRTHLRMN